MISNLSQDPYVTCSSWTLAPLRSCGLPIPIFMVLPTSAWLSSVGAHSPVSFSGVSVPRDTIKGSPSVESLGFFTSYEH